MKIHRLEIQKAIENLELAKKALDDAILDMYCDGHSFADIARILGCSRQNVVRKYGPMVTRVRVRKD